MNTNYFNRGLDIEFDNKLKQSFKDASTNEAQYFSLFSQWSTNPYCFETRRPNAVPVEYWNHEYWGDGLLGSVYENHCQTPSIQPEWQGPAPYATNYYEKRTQLFGILNDLTIPFLAGLGMTIYGAASGYLYGSIALINKYSIWYPGEIPDLKYWINLTVSYVKDGVRLYPVEYSADNGDNWSSQPNTGSYAVPTPSGPSPSNSPVILVLPETDDGTVYNIRAQLEDVDQGILYPEMAVDLTIKRTPSAPYQPDWLKIITSYPKFNTPYSNKTFVLFKDNTSLDWGYPCLIPLFNADPIQSDPTGVYKIHSGIIAGTLNGDETISVHQPATCYIQPKTQLGITWCYPRMVAVSGATLTNYDATTGRLELANPTAKVSVGGVCFYYHISTNLEGVRCLPTPSRIGLNSLSFAITANDGYQLPTTISVTNADYNYTYATDRQSGMVVLSSAVDDVSLEIIGTPI